MLFSSSLYRSDFTTGSLWLIDADGGLHFVAKEGDTLGDETGSATLDEFLFNRFAGETAARSVTLGDDGTVAFLGLTPDGPDEDSSRDSAVFRAHVVAKGKQLFWSGEAGNKQWFGKSGTHSNWKDENGINWSDPPGARRN